MRSTNGRVEVEQMRNNQVRSKLKMKILVLVFHPNLNESRINRRLVEEIQKLEGDQVIIRNEYELYPDGHIDVLAEQTIVEQHDRIVLQFPFYWYSSPALLKEWQDQVLSFGWAYGPNGNKLHGKELLVAITVGSASERYGRRNPVGYSPVELLSPFDATSSLIGVKYLEPFVLMGVSENYSDCQLESDAKRYAEYVLSTPALA